MMVRDERRTIIKAIASVRPYVDRLTVMDTGSTDGTQLLVAQEAARGVIDELWSVPWSGNFGDMRTLSMSRAASEWILILDGDEYLEPTADWAKLRAVLSSPSCQNIAALKLRVVNHLAQGRVRHAHYQERVLRCDERLYYRDAAHHRLTLSAFCTSTGLVVGQYAGAEIQHTGYDLTPKERREKYRKRLPALMRAIREADHPGIKAYKTYQYARALYQVGEYRKAQRWNDVVLRDVDTLPREYVPLALHDRVKILVTLNRAHRRVGRDEALAAVEAMLPHAMNEPLMLHQAGSLLCHAGEETRGLVLMLKAHALAKAGSPGATYELDEYQVRNDFCHVLALGGLEVAAEAIMDADAEEAHRVMRHALKRDVLQVA